MADSDRTQPAIEDGIHSAIAIIRAYPQIIRDNAPRPNAEVWRGLPAFEEVVQGEWQRMLDSYGEEATRRFLVRGLTVIAAMVADQTASDHGTTRDVLLDTLAFNTLMEGIARPDEPK